MWEVDHKVGHGHFDTVKMEGQGTGCQIDTKTFQKISKFIYEHTWQENRTDKFEFIDINSLVNLILYTPTIPHHL